MPVFRVDYLLEKRLDQESVIPSPEEVLQDDWITPQGWTALDAQQSWIDQNSGALVLGCRALP